MAETTLRLRDCFKFTNDIGLAHYPIFDEDYRLHLNDKILQHYDEREIGHETVPMFTFALRRKMNEIMPLYNQRYKSELLVIDPLNTVKLKTIIDNENLGSSVVDSTNGVAETVTTASTGTTGSTTATDETGATSSVSDGTTDSTVTNDGTAATTSLTDGTTDTTNTVDGTNGTTVDSTNTTADHTRAVQQAMPQVRLSGNGDYATSANDVSTDNTVTGANTTDEVSHSVGVTATGTHTDSSGDETTHSTSVTAGSSHSADSGDSERHVDVVGTGTSKDDGTAVTARDMVDNRIGNTSDNLHGVTDVLGYNGSQSELLNLYRQTFINIDMEVIAELEELFFGLWNNGDSYSEGRTYHGFYY